MNTSKSAIKDGLNTDEMRARIKELEEDKEELLEQLANSQKENEFLIKNAAEEI